MTEKTPPPGKTWLTIEVESGTEWADWSETVIGRPVVGRVHGPDPEDPSDKCNRLLGQAESRFRDAVYAFRDPSQPMHNAPAHMSAGLDFLAEALKVLREEL